MNKERVMRRLIEMGLAFLACNAVTSSVTYAQLQEPPTAMRWYVTNQTLNEIDATIEIDARSQLVKLNQNWTCLVGGMTANGKSSYRETNCTNDGKAIAFTVECGPTRTKEHVQLRFKDKNGRPVDFIEIGCEIDGPVRGLPKSQDRSDP
jgi:hypothetical protein